jgi:hypothetical protein
MSVKVTVGATGADYTSLNSAIDYISGLNGGVIEIIDDLHYYATAGLSKNVSNITFQAKNANEGVGASMIFWNSGVGGWSGYNVKFIGFAIRGRPGSSGSLLTAPAAGGHFWFTNCILMLDGSTSPSLATSLLNCNSSVCKVYMHNCYMSSPAAPGYRRIVSGDSSTIFYMSGRSQLNATTPSIVYRDSGCTIAAGTITTDTIYSNHNSMTNIQAAASGVTNGHVNDQVQTIYGRKDFSNGLKVLDTADATSLTTGSIISSGGMGLAKTLCCNGLIVSGEQYVSSTESLSLSPSVGDWTADTSPLNFNVSKLGHTVTLAWPVISGTGGTGYNYTISSSAIPADYRTTTPYMFPALDGNNQCVTATMGTDGVLSFGEFSSADAGLKASCITYYK